ncbi:MAG TPA: methyltransferase domain-containing protein [Actinomycetes bacterium]|nr:methyltransferase domain-containing protein [Actinomycetes bacterium]
MAHDFDEQYWQKHWHEAPNTEPGAGSASEPNPYLVREIGSLSPGTALDAGCGEGSEAIWLASRGWQVMAVDISADAIARASDRAAARIAEDGLPRDLQWLRADLTVWDPGTQFDLVTTHYAHPSTSQLAFYERLSGWVAVGGTLFIVGHLHTAGHGHDPPEEASVTLTDITAGLDSDRWEFVTAEEHVRTFTAPGGDDVSLHDVVVSATRLA